MKADYHKPAHIDDEIASKTKWTSAVSGEKTFAGLKIKQIDNEKVYLVPTIFSSLFYSVFIFIGLALTYGGAKVDGYIRISLIIVGLVISISMIYVLIKNLNIKIVFDKKSSQINFSNEKTLQLSNLHAIQIIPRLTRSSGEASNYYFVYELNLAFKGGERENLMYHSGIDYLLHDASRLRDFLNIPVWQLKSISLDC